MPHWPGQAKHVRNIPRDDPTPGAACSLTRATNRQSATSGTPRPTIRSLPGHGTGLEGPQAPAACNFRHCRGSEPIPMLSPRTWPAPRVPDEDPLLLAPALTAPVAARARRQRHLRRRRHRRAGDHLEAGLRPAVEQPLRLPPGGAGRRAVRRHPRATSSRSTAARCSSPRRTSPASTRTRPPSTTTSSPATRPRRRRSSPCTSSVDQRSAYARSLLKQDIFHFDGNDRWYYDREKVAGRVRRNWTRCGSSR